MSCKGSTPANWFVMWQADKSAMLSTMIHNMAADLDAGYDPLGSSITHQLHNIANYRADFNETLNSFEGKAFPEINRWCYNDLKRRGAIS